jgi:hypothetical protein
MGRVSDVSTDPLPLSLSAACRFFLNFKRFSLGCRVYVHVPVFDMPGSDDASINANRSSFLY